MSLPVTEWFNFPARAYTLDAARTLVTFGPGTVSAAMLVADSDLVRPPPGYAPWPSSLVEPGRVDAYLQHPCVLICHADLDRWLRWASRRGSSLSGDGSRYADPQLLATDGRFPHPFDRRLIHEALIPFVQLRCEIIAAHLATRESGPFVRIIGSRITTVVMATDDAPGMDPFLGGWWER